MLWSGLVTEQSPWQHPLVYPAVVQLVGGGAGTVVGAIIAGAVDGGAVDGGAVDGGAVDGWWYCCWCCLEQGK